MNDRELLELAAEAGGIEYAAPQSGTNVSLRDTPYWNSLDSNGDALALAVRLRMRVEAGVAIAYPKNYFPIVVEVIEKDLEKATRRAITKAAAEHARIARAQSTT